MTRWILLSLVLFAACGQDEAPMVEEFCETSIEIVGHVRPTYQFEGGGVLAISVVRKSKPDAIVWGLATPDKDAVESPLKHGDRLMGAVETSRDEPTLKEAVTYLVRIQRTSGEVCVVEFTP